MGSMLDVHLPPGVDSCQATPLGTKLAKRGRGKMIHLLAQHRLHVAFGSWRQGKLPAHTHTHNTHTHTHTLGTARQE